MKKIFFILLVTSLIYSQETINLYSFSAKSIDGKEIPMKSFEGKVLLVVNTASKCGLTPQYEGLQKLYTEFKDRDFEILGFPCNQFAGQEPGTSEEIQKFCTGEYGVTFKMFDKVDVRGENPHPIFKYLVENTKYDGFDLKTPMGERFQNFLSAKFPEILKGKGIKWNFTKFLVDKNGNVLKRFEPTIKPEEIKDELKKLLN